MNPPDDPTGGSDATVTWRELHRELVGQLGDPTARWLCEEASGHDHGDWLVGQDDAATVRAVARLDDLARRCRSGEPVQYVLGHWPFRTLDLAVDRRVLIPRPETEHVVELALVELDRLGGRERSTVVVDLGTGSGAIGLSIAVERPLATVTATDRSTDALAVARANTAGLGRAGARVTLVEGLWFDALHASMRGAVDLVIANPPYVGAGEDLPVSVEAWEPAGALRAGPDGLDDLRVIVASAPEWLAPHGVLVVEHAPDQGPVLVSLAISVGFASAEVVPDLTGRPRALIARRRS